GRRHPGAVRHGRPGRGRGAAARRARGGNGRPATGDRAAAGLRPRRGVDAPVGRPGQRGAADLRAEDQPSGRRALLLRALSHALAPPGLRIHRLADPPVPAPRQRPPTPTEDATLTGRWRPGRTTLLVVGLLVGAGVLLSVGRPRSLKL